MAGLSQTIWDKPAFFVARGLNRGRRGLVEQMSVRQPAGLGRLLAPVPACARRTLILFLTVLLSAACPGAAETFLLAPLKLLAAEDDSDRPSQEEELRETTPKLFRLRGCRLQARSAVPGRWPALNNVRSPARVQDPTLPSQGHRLGAGICRVC